MIVHGMHGNDGTLRATAIQLLFVPTKRRKKNERIKSGNVCDIHRFSTSLMPDILLVRKWEK